MWGGRYLPDAWTELGVSEAPRDQVQGQWRHEKAEWRG